MIKQSIDIDIKSAMLSGDKQLVSVLRTIKSVILDKEVNSGSRETGLEESVVIDLLQKEQKKRFEAAELYKNAGDEARATQELFEAETLAKYLPEMMSEAETLTLVEEVLNGYPEKSMQIMGQVIGAVKAKGGATVDGALIAKLVKEKLSA